MRDYNFSQAQAIIHPSAEVIAGGWNSTIHRLAIHGWKFKIEHDCRAMSYRVLGRNPSGNVVGMFEIHDCHLVHQMQNFIYFPESVVATAERGIFNEIHHPAIQNLISADVGIVNTATMEVLHVYTPSDNDAPQEIIVTQDKVPELLSAIREAQADNARKLLHKQNARERSEYQKLKQEAKILSFG